MAAQTKQWTLDELHRLPDDGNKYELVRGELFVTPAPTEVHETILARLSGILQPYVVEQELGMVFHPRAVVRFEGSEVEPDLMVRAVRRVAEKDWDDAPAPVLVVEVLSASTRRRDRGAKREFYRDVGVGEYWVIDPEAESVLIIRGEEARVVTADERLAWHPSAAAEPLVLRVFDVFQDLH